jgi:hypothetical protein
VQVVLKIFFSAACVRGAPLATLYSTVQYQVAPVQILHIIFVFFMLYTGNGVEIGTTV